MGQRANLLIVENGEYEIYYDHWCANSLDRVLFWGVEQALEFFRSHDTSGPDCWLDTRWAEGGAIIDLDAKKLLFFGGEDIYFCIPLRRVYLRLLETMWPDYKIQWANEGIVDIARYVGYELNKVIIPSAKCKPVKPFSPEFLKVNKPGDADCVISVNECPSCKMWPTVALLTRPDTLLWHGPEILSCIRQNCDSLEKFSFSAMEQGWFPQGGVHIDTWSKTLLFWLSPPKYIDMELLQTVWPGWSIHNDHDRYERQAELTRGKLSFPRIEVRFLVDWVREMVCKKSSDPVANFNDVAALLCKEGLNVEINTPMVYEGKSFTPPVIDQVAVLKSWQGKCLADFEV